MYLSYVSEQGMQPMLSGFVMIYVKYPTETAHFNDAIPGI